MCVLFLNNLKDFFLPLRLYCNKSFFEDGRVGQLEESVIFPTAFCNPERFFAEYVDDGEIIHDGVLKGLGDTGGGVLALILSGAQG